MRQISRDELRALLDAGDVVLVEALPAAHFAAEHIAGAVNVPEVTADSASAVAPDRSTPVVTYCSGPGCARSKVAAAAFARLGYTDIRVYAGGKAEAGLPFEGARARPVDRAA